MTPEAELIESANALAQLIEGAAANPTQKKRDKDLRRPARRIEKLARSRFRAQLKAVLAGLASDISSLSQAPDRESQSEDEEEDRKIRLRDLLLLLFWPRVYLVTVTTSQQEVFADAVEQATVAGKDVAEIQFSRSADISAIDNPDDSGIVPGKNTPRVVDGSGVSTSDAISPAVPAKSIADTSNNQAVQQLAIVTPPKPSAGAVKPSADSESFMAAYLKKNGFTQLAGELDKTTTESLAAVVADAYESGATFDETVTAVKDKFKEFTTSRAKTIAQTELNRAFNQSVMHFGKQAGAEEKWWETDFAPCLICTTNALAGRIPIDDLFPSGDDAPGAHPNCLCSMMVGAAL